MFNFTATHFAYYILCKRKFWLFNQQIEMEHNSDLVAEGKLIEEESYERRAEQYTQVHLPGIRIDFFDPKEKVVHEVKKSKKMEDTHVAQVSYYLYVLHKHGIEGCSGRIEYPKLRRQTTVPPLDAENIALIEEVIQEMEVLAASEACPPCINQPFCQNCAYYDFCYADEE